MYSHSYITIAWMAATLPFGHPWASAFISIAWWWSREQYLTEYRLRKVQRDSWRDVIFTIYDVWYPREKNMDLIAPAIVALVLALVIDIATRLL